MFFLGVERGEISLAPPPEKKLFSPPPQKKPFWPSKKKSPLPPKKQKRNGPPPPKKKNPSRCWPSHSTVLLRIADCQGPLTFTFVLYCLTYCPIYTKKKILPPKKCWPSKNSPSPPKKNKNKMDPPKKPHLFYPPGVTLIQLYYWGLPIAKVSLLSLSFYTAWQTALYNMEKDILLLYCTLTIR